LSVDTVFQPKLPTILVVAAGVQVVPQGTGQGTTMSFRVFNLSATAQRFGYGNTAARALANAVAPTAAPGVQSITMLPNSVETFEFSTSTFFAADNATGFEFSPGQGT